MYCCLVLIVGIWGHKSMSNLVILHPPITFPNTTWSFLFLTGCVACSSSRYNDLGKIMAKRRNQGEKLEDYLSCRVTLKPKRTEHTLDGGHWSLKTLEKDLNFSLVCQGTACQSVYITLWKGVKLYWVAFTLLASSSNSVHARSGPWRREVPFSSPQLI